jgi:hypothetical protein
MRGVRNQLLYSLMSDVFLLAKEEARYRQPTDVQEPKASYAAVLTGRCTGAETVACRCPNSSKGWREDKCLSCVGRSERGERGEVFLSVLEGPRYSHEGHHAI